MTPLIHHNLIFINKKGDYSDNGDDDDADNKSIPKI
jgi:hypothetical protein